MKIETSRSRGGRLFKWLEWGRAELAFLGEDEAREECEQILETLLGVSRTELYLSSEPDPLAFPQFSEWVEARKERTPLAYLLGKTHFWDDKFEVEEGVFIPRPETEEIIESFLNTEQFSRGEKFRFLDLGTGSGNIAVTIAKLFPNSQGFASDLSLQALAATDRNARRLGVRDRLKLIHSDALAAFREETFDVIFSNPPYVASRDWEGLDPEVRREPRLALNGGRDGLDFYRRIFQGLSCLRPGGSLWVEIGWDETDQVRSLFEKAGFRETRIFKDLNQIDRIVCGIHFS